MTNGVIQENRPEFKASEENTFHFTTKQLGDTMLPIPCRMNEAAAVPTRHGFETDLKSGR
jgi:hypothetical protein